ncbi:sugar kinase [Sagittula sp. SSi028]|uniref:sugar kinase n=1 Tax=Sagittula sp. SSi028 TaxID=3400636 RepID=UPI003AF8B5E0
MTSFLSLGEIMVELAPAQGGLMRQGYAGDTFNTAWYARRLLDDAWTVSYGTVIGEDAVSDAMADFIAAEGVATDALARHPDRTVGLYMISLQNGERSFSYWRGQAAARTLGDDPARLRAMLSGRSYIHFSGITLAILPPEARQSFCDALAEARANGAHVSFDTNLRPRLWESRDAMIAGLTLGASVADTVLPSFDEEETIFPDQSPQDTISRYAKGGATCVVVKNGSGAVQAWSADEGHLEIAPPVVTQVVDSTAAGDSFAAGFLAARATGASLQSATQAASLLASEVIQKRGALAHDLFTDT